MLTALHKHRSSPGEASSTEVVRAQLPLAAPVVAEPVGRSLSDALDEAPKDEEVYETPDQKRRKVVGQARPRPPLGESSTKADAPAQ